MTYQPRKLKIRPNEERSAVVKRFEPSPAEKLRLEAWWLETVRPKITRSGCHQLEPYGRAILGFAVGSFGIDSGSYQLILEGAERMRSAVVWKFREQLGEGPEYVPHGGLDEWRWPLEAWLHLCDELVKVDWRKGGE